MGVSSYTSTSCSTVSSNGDCDSSFTLTAKEDDTKNYIECTKYQANGQSCTSEPMYKEN
jgi:hypothetical protein